MFLKGAADPGNNILKSQSLFKDTQISWIESKSRSFRGLNTASVLGEPFCLMSELLQDPHFSALRTRKLIQEEHGVDLSLSTSTSSKFEYSNKHTEQQAEIGCS